MSGYIKTDRDFSHPILFITHLFKDGTCKIEQRDSGQNFSSISIKETPDGLEVREVIAPASRLIIFGIGHVGQATALCARFAGFDVLVCDERRDLEADQKLHQYGIETMCAPWNELIKKAQITPRDYVCIMTPGHLFDFEILKQVLQGEMPCYLGQIGSRRKIAQFWQELESEGIPKEILDAIHAPIGLDIHANTPQEIAVSITAQMIEVKNAPADKQASDIDVNIIEEQNKLEGDRVVMTILESRGSTPRKAGSKMILDETGSFAGTIGGGLAENQAMEAAKKLMHTNNWQILDFNMSNDLAARAGMICGGSIKVLLCAVPA